MACDGISLSLACLSFIVSFVFSGDFCICVIVFGSLILWRCLCDACKNTTLTALSFHYNCVVSKSIAVATVINTH